MVLGVVGQHCHNIRSLLHVCVVPKHASLAVPWDVGFHDSMHTAEGWLMSSNLYDHSLTCRRHDE